jgi:MoaA/NifB/PqqE/SkfB family radical SAM enzyme
LPQLKQLGIKSIDFTGGEPLLYPGLPRLIQEAKKFGFFTSLTTNGVLYPKYAHQLKGNLLALSFSLDAADAASHNKIRGIQCFDKTIRSILLARRLGELVMLKTTVCQSSISKIPALIDLAARYGILIELNAEFSYFHNPHLHTKAIQQMKRWYRHPNVIISHAHLQFMLDGGNDVRHPKCQNGKVVLVLSPDNKIFWPCMHKVEFLFPLQDHSLIKTVNNHRYRAELVYMGSYAVCDSCTIPCYMEPVYYVQFDKYFLWMLWSRLGYIKKRLILTLKIKSLRI